jgi:Tfp pilus assembly protein PilO
VGLLFGRVPNGVGRAQVTGIFGVPWKLVACVLAAVAILGLLYFFGESRHAQGVAEEQARNAEKVAEIQANAARAIQQEAQAFRDSNAARDRRFTQAIQTIEDIPNDAPASDFLVGYARAERSLRDGTGNQ